MLSKENKESYTEFVKQKNIEILQWRHWDNESKQEDTRITSWRHPDVLIAKWKFI